MIIYQSPLRAKMHLKYSDNIFHEGTFYTAPKMSYQLFITRIYAEDINMFVTTSFSLLLDKQQSTYENCFNEIKNNILKYSANTTYNPNYIHVDFERAISNDIKIIFPNIKIRCCICHYKRNQEIHKKEICKKDIHSNNEIYILYKYITNFPFINSEYILDIYHKIFNETDNNNFKEFLKYFKKTYLIRFEIK